MCIKGSDLDHYLNLMGSNLDQNPSFHIDEDPTIVKSSIDRGIQMKVPTHSVPLKYHISNICSRENNFLYMYTRPSDPLRCSTLGAVRIFFFFFFFFVICLWSYFTQYYNVRCLCYTIVKQLQ